MQRPLLLKGHTRSITLIKYNRDGDLLFSCSKDSTPCVWMADSGERIGTYEGHTGAVYGLDITRKWITVMTCMCWCDCVRLSWVVLVA